MKITYHVIGESYVIQGHTFINEHNHCVYDVVGFQPLVKSNKAAMVIDEVIHSTPKYQSRKIGKDFVREHGMRLSYCQAWQIKKKAKKKVFG